MIPSLQYYWKVAKLSAVGLDNYGTAASWSIDEVGTEDGPRLYYVGRCNSCVIEPFKFDGWWKLTATASELTIPTRGCTATATSNLEVNGIQRTIDVRLSLDTFDPYCTRGIYPVNLMSITPGLVGRLGIAVDMYWVRDIDPEEWALYYAGWFTRVGDLALSLGSVSDSEGN